MAKTMMNWEAIEVLRKNFPKICKMVDGRLKDGFDDTESEFGQALTVAIAAIQKQIPKLVTEIHCDEYFCPACGAENNAELYKVSDNYCPVCGQRLAVELYRRG